MTNEQQVICNLIAKTLFGAESEFSPEISWNDVYLECIRQTIPGMVVSAIPPEAPFEVRMKWINASGVNSASNQKVSEGHFEIHKLLTENQIPYTILKGLATASYYPDPDMRSLGDVDFLIRNEDAERCDRLLTEKGFSAEDNRLPYEWGYMKGTLEYELHLSINGIPEGDAKLVTEGYLSDIIETSVLSDAYAEELKLPDDFHHGLVILLHTAKHMVGEGVGFRQICDWAVFVSRLGERFPALFEEALKKIGIWNYALILSAVCSKYIGMPIFSWMENFEDDFLELVMEDLLRKGNLRKEADSGVDTIMVEKTDSGGVAEGSMLIQLYKNLAQKTKYKWPVMNRKKVLIPFGVAVMCIQYGAGTLSGKYKKINPKKLVKNAEARRRLYRELQLFKENEDNAEENENV